MGHFLLDLPTMDNSLFKVVILGDIAAGKTSLLSQFAFKHFKETYKATIGSDFVTREISLDSNIVTLQIWDTAGQERFRSLSTAFFRGTDVCILVYDVCDSKTLDSLRQWKEEFIEQVEVEADFPFVVIGNKIDLESNRQVSKSKGESVSQDIGAKCHFEASAKTAQNVEKAFYGAAKEAMKRSLAKRSIEDYTKLDTTFKTPTPNINGNKLLNDKSSSTKENEIGPCC